MKKIKTFSFLLIALILVSITVIHENSSASKSNIIVPNYTANTDLSQEREKPDTKINVLYTVKEQNGIIVVYKNGKPEPVMTDRVHVNALPAEDRQRLKSGVEFSNYKDMVSFLENYE